jgi:hypothetical protein
MSAVTRDQHFARLNSYRHSREYATFAANIGDDVPEGDLPSLLGARWEIDARLYNEFLELLPPLDWNGRSFLMREFVFDSITTKYSREGDRYFCEFFRRQRSRGLER